ncbi:MAG TPA: HU family DNA-binding protein [Oligoflexia bacterium]|nr:HU family DNA-binding protein [Oligoflexia bacterium]HMP47878.1 HU family DNA-binding protein [Oligoflexia bacterium]
MWEKCAILWGLGFLLHIVLIGNSQISFAASSFDDLVSEVAEETSFSRTEVESILRASFKRIGERMREDKGTSIPDFGRYTVAEKIKRQGKDREGYEIAGGVVRSPRFSFSKEFKLFLEEKGVKRKKQKQGR